MVSCLRLPKVSQCCCGCSLERGTFIIAWIEVGCGLLIIFASILSLLSQNKDATPDEVLVSTGITGTYILAGLTQITLGIVLIISVFKSILNFIQTWVTISITMLFLYSGVMLTETGLLIYEGITDIAILILFFGTVAIVVNLYLIIVVSSYRKEKIAESEENTNNLSQNRHNIWTT